MCNYWLRTWRHTCTLHLHTPFAYAIITKTSYAFFAKITLCIFYPMTPFAHAFAYAIKKTPYAFFAKITLCMYILCGLTVCQDFPGNLGKYIFRLMIAPLHCLTSTSWPHYIRNVCYWLNNLLAPLYKNIHKVFNIYNKVL